VGPGALSRFGVADLLLLRRVSTCNNGNSSKAGEAVDRSNNNKNTQNTPQNTQHDFSIDSHAAELLLVIYSFLLVLGSTAIIIATTASISSATTSSCRTTKRRIAYTTRDVSSTQHYLNSHSFICFERLESPQLLHYITVMHIVANRYCHNIVFRSVHVVHGRCIHSIFFVFLLYLLRTMASIHVRSSALGLHI